MYTYVQFNIVDLSAILLFQCTGQSLRQGRHADVHNNNVLNYVLDELMPWHEEDGLRDFSLLEVNSYFICNHVMMSCNPSMHIEVSVKLENSAGKHQLLL